MRGSGEARWAPGAAQSPSCGVWRGLLCPRSSPPPTPPCVSTLLTSPLVSYPLTSFGDTCTNLLIWPLTSDPFSTQWWPGHLSPMLGWLRPRPCLSPSPASHYFQSLHPHPLPAAAFRTRSKLSWSLPQPPPHSSYTKRTVVLE